MKIPVILNDEEKIFDVEPDCTLMKVLQNNGCTSVKCGCASGSCGSCSVLLNDIPVASCQIPVGIIRSEKITTLEYFSKTEDIAANCRNNCPENIVLSQNVQA